MIIAFEAGVKYKGKIYCSAMNMNGFFVFDPLSKKTELISVFAEEPIKNWLHGQAFLHKHTMWLMPYQANNICSVDLDSMEMKYYSISSDKKNEVDGLFHSGVCAGDNIYLIPQTSHMKCAHEP